MCKCNEFMDRSLDSMQSYCVQAGIAAHLLAGQQSGTYLMMVKISRADNILKHYMLMPL